MIVASILHSSLAAAAAKSLQLCPTLCDPIDGSLPGSAVPGILQARTLEWVAISFSNRELKRFCFYSHLCMSFTTLVSGKPNSELTAICSRCSGHWFKKIKNVQYMYIQVLNY